MPIINRAAVREIRYTDAKPNTILSNGEEAGSVAHQFLQQRVFQQLKKRIYQNNKEKKKQQE